MRFTSILGLALVLASGASAALTPRAPRKLLTDEDYQDILDEIASDPHDFDQRYSMIHRPHPEDFPFTGDIGEGGANVQKRWKRILNEISVANLTEDEKMLVGKYFLASMNDKALGYDDSACDDEQWGKIMTMYDEAVFLARNVLNGDKISESNSIFSTIFGKDLPRASGPATASDISKIKRIFTEIANHERRPFDQTKVLTFICASDEVPRMCNANSLAYAIGNVVTFCPLSWAGDQASLKLPRTAAEAKNSQLCKADQDHFIQSKIVTVLHELTHVINHGPDKTIDHAYGFEQMDLEANPTDKNIFSLTPTEAANNAESFAFFAMFDLRAQLCGIPAQISQPERFVCGKDTTPTAYLKLGAKFDSLEPNCDVTPSSCATTATATNQNVKRQTVTGEICCPVNQKAVRVRNPKTGKLTTDCRCAKGFVESKSASGAIQCTRECGADSIEDKTAGCIVCPAGQVPNDTQTMCVPGTASEVNSTTALSTSAPTATSAALTPTSAGDVSKSTATTLSPAIPNSTALTASTLAATGAAESTATTLSAAVPSTSTALKPTSTRAASASKSTASTTAKLSSTRVARPSTVKSRPTATKKSKPKATKTPKKCPKGVSKC